MCLYSSKEKIQRVGHLVYISYETNFFGIACEEINLYPGKVAIKVSIEGGKSVPKVALSILKMNDDEIKSKDSIKPLFISAAAIGSKENYK